MKPADHPEFFRFPPPEGRSRESTLRLDPNGRFWHDGALVEHDKLSRALHSWISRHPDDGRYVLTNGYDWTYLTVDDAPYLVRSVKIGQDRIDLVLSDGSEEAWVPETSRIGKDEAVYAVVKRQARGGPYDAKFSPHAQSSLAPWLVETDAGQPAVRIGDRFALVGAPVGNRRTVE